MQPTDINHYRSERESPDSDLVYVDEYNVTWGCYAASYTDSDGMVMAFSFWAKSPEDAESRLKQIAENGRIDGRLHAVMDC